MSTDRTGASSSRVVVFEETGEERTVTGYCKRCRAVPDDFPTVLISPRGMAHHGLDDHTVCGFDATGPDWWWPL